MIRSTILVLLGLTAVLLLIRFFRKGGRTSESEAAEVARKRLAMERARSTRADRNPEHEPPGSTDDPAGTGKH